jgi:serine/threonine protein kinase
MCSKKTVLGSCSAQTKALKKEKQVNAETNVVNATSAQHHLDDVKPIMSAQQVRDTEKVSNTSLWPCKDKLNKDIPLQQRHMYLTWLYQDLVSKESLNVYNLYLTTVILLDTVSSHIPVKPHQYNLYLITCFMIAEKFLNGTSISLIDYARMSKRNKSVSATSARQPKGVNPASGGRQPKVVKTNKIGPNDLKSCEQKIFDVLRGNVYIELPYSGNDLVVKQLLCLVYFHSEYANYNSERILEAVLFLLNQSDKAHPDIVNWIRSLIETHNVTDFGLIYDKSLHMLSDIIINTSEPLPSEIEITSTEWIKPELYNHAKYKRIDTLGSGTFGTTYVINSKIDHKDYVFKEIIKEKDIGVPYTVYREIAYLLRCHHENVVSLIAADWHGLLLEKMDDDLWYTEVKVANKYELQEDICVQLCAGVKHIHAKGVIHRDLKIDNILIKKVDDKVIIKIADFGSANRMVGYNVDNNFLSHGLGVLESRAPELLLGSEIYDQRVDVWSLGIILYELVIDKEMFRVDTNAEAIEYLLGIFGYPKKWSFSRFYTKEVSRTSCVEKLDDEPDDLPNLERSNERTTAKSVEHRNWLEFEDLPEYEERYEKIEKDTELTFDSRFSSKVIEIIKQCLIFNPGERPYIYEIII